MPDQMLRYRAAAFFGRIYAPELLMGLPAADEVRDTVVLTEDADGGYTAETPTEPAAVRQPQSKSAMAAAADAPLQPSTYAETVEPKAEKSPTGPVDQATGEIAQPAKPVAQHTDAHVASPGQRKNILGRVAGNGLDLRATLTQAGLGELPDDLEGLTVDGFQAIKDILPKV